MRLIIGDIHACFEELMDMLDVVSPSSDDEIVSVGDLPDRGPDSPGVVTFFSRTKNAKAIKGNHERKHDRIMRGLMNPGNLGKAQRKTIFQFNEAKRIGGDTLSYPDAVAFFGGLPLYLDLPEALIVHAGIEYGLPFEEQNEQVLTGSGFHHMNRHTPDGLFEWCTTYPSDAKPVIFGHLGVGKAPWSLPQRGNLWPIDTGCASGGYLTAVALPDFKVYRVKSRQPEKTRKSR